MLIGDQRVIELRINSDTPIEPDSISFSSWQGLGIDPLNRQNWIQEGAGSFHQQITVAAFDTGYILLPPLVLPYDTGSGRDTTYSNDLAIEVAGILVDSTGLAPIKPIIREPFSLRDLVPYLIALGIGLAIIGLVFLRKKRVVPEEVIVEIPLPAHEVALADLEKLRHQKLWQQGKIKAYQSELTHIIRAYIEARFAVPALESTTSEILDFSEVKVLGDDLNASLSEILNMADLIKFAKAEPEISIHDDFMKKAELFILSTKEEITETEDV
ncbi:MAG: hypothetical protein HKN76_10720 [Saprospiraceae bacterium]|nr:hypothetical protein [Saprospiraceae bacterium]